MFAVQSMRWPIIVLLCIAVMLAGCATPPKQSRVLIQTPTGTVEVRVEIADTPVELETGLMYRDSLPEDEGMLFIFEKEGRVSFWMKNTLIPLDIIFINSDWKVVNIHHSVQPCKESPIVIGPCESYFSDAPILYVLEVNAGFAEQHDIKQGTSIRLVT